MSLLFIDSCNHYQNSATMLQKWDLGSGCYFEVGKGRRGGNALGFGGAYCQAVKYVPNPALKLYIGVATFVGGAGSYSG